MIKLDAVRLPSWQDIRSARKAIWLSSVLGTFIGILPALGATTAALIAYNETKRWSKKQGGVRQGRDRGRRRTGGREQRRGRRRDGADAGARHPRQHHDRDHPRRPDGAGRAPRPHLFTEQPTLLYVVFGSMLLANLLYLVLGLGFAKVFARISLIPAPFLWPAVFVLSVIGAYAPNQSMADVWVVIAFGFIGFFMGATASRRRRWSWAWCSAGWWRRR